MKNIFMFVIKVVSAGILFLVGKYTAEHLSKSTIKIEMRKP